MDIPRPRTNARNASGRWAFAAGGVLVITAATAGLMRLEPAAPSVAIASVWPDTVREGEMLREVRGPGTLVPRAIRWIGAQAEGRVERVIVRPGAVVQADTVLLEMSNPELVQETEQAPTPSRRAEAELAELKLTLENKQLDQRAARRGRPRRVRKRAPAEPRRRRHAGNVVPRSSTSAPSSWPSSSRCVGNRAGAARPVRGLDEGAARGAQGARHAGSQRLRAHARARRVARGARRRRGRRAGGARRGRPAARAPARTSRASRGPTSCRRSSACRRPRRATCCSASS